MEESFDPYRLWLAIPPEEQPPNHYRLLGVGLFESDPDVIATAADARMVHLKTFQTGRHTDLSERLLNEVTAAKLCLLEPQRKAEYDVQLRRRLAGSKPLIPEPPPVPPPPQPPPALPPQQKPRPVVSVGAGVPGVGISEVSSYVTRRKRRRLAIRLLVLVVLALLAVLLVYLLFHGGAGPWI